jgi:N-acetylmuramoyl-L-alanine amidase
MFTREGQAQAGASTSARRRAFFFSFALTLAAVSLYAGQARRSAPATASAAMITCCAGTYAAAPLEAYRVGVQIGHYKNNELPPQLSRLVGSTGTYGGGRSEVDLNADIAVRLAALLRDQGVLVDVLPATVPTAYTADAFVAIHADGNSWPGARGFKISTRWRSEVAVQDARLVDMLTDSYRAATGLPEDSSVTRNMRGYYAYAPWRPNYRTSNFTPGAIVEMGFMTNAADRQVMFKAPDKVASGIAAGIMAFLQDAYSSPRLSRSYGYGIIDGDIDANAPEPTPVPAGAQRAPASRVQRGNWDLFLMGKSTVNVYAKAGGGQVIAGLPREQFVHSTLRDGDYYRITLPGGKEGWVHRNAVVVKM